MAGTLSGGKLAAKTNKERYGEDFFKVQGRKGGLVKGTRGGFASVCKCKTYSEEHLKARCSGYKGGRISKRGKDKKKW